MIAIKTSKKVLSKISKKFSAKELKVQKII